MRTVLTILLLLLTGCSHTGADGRIAAIQEAVFRYQFERNASVQQQRASVYFLAFGDPHERGKGAVDPSDEFIGRFAASKTRIAKFSAAERIDGGWVTDKKTKEGGIIFFVHDVRIIDDDTAEAKGGYLEDRRSASGNTFRLRRAQDGWRVVDESMEWISRKEPNQRPEPMSVLRTAMAHH